MGKHLPRQKYKTTLFWKVSPTRPRAAAIRRSPRGPWIRSTSSPRAYPRQSRRPSRHQASPALDSPALGICLRTQQLSGCVPTPLLPPACTIGPLTLSARTATVLAHGPVLGPRLRIATRAAPQRPKLSGTSRTIRHPGQCSTSPPQPGAALRLIALPLFRAALVHACLCTSLHRCTPRTAPLSMRSAAPCGSA